METCANVRGASPLQWIERREILDEAHPDSSFSLDTLMAPDDVWPDAELPSVLNFIEGRCGDMCQC